MQSSNKTLVTIVVIIVIVVVGYFIFTNKSTSQAPLQSTGTSTAAKQEQAPAVFQMTVSPSKIALLDLKKIVSDRGANPSSEKLAAYSKAIDEATVKTGTLDISGCLFTPNVIGLKPGDKMTVINKDSVAHVLAYGGAGPETIPATGTKEITLKFPNATSPSVVATMTCDTDKADQFGGIVNIQP